MLTKLEPVSQESLNPLHRAHTQANPQQDAPLKTITNSTSYFTCRVTEARWTWRAWESSCVTEHKQARQWNPVDRAWARGQGFLNPNPSPTAIFCTALAYWSGGILGFKSVIWIFCAIGKELLPCFPRKIGNLVYYTVRLHKLQHTTLFRRLQSLSKPTQYFGILCLQFTHFQIGRCRSPSSFPPFKRR